MHRPLFRIIALAALMTAAAGVSAGPPHGHRGPHHDRGPYHERGPVQHHRRHVRPGTEGHRATIHRDQRAHRYAGIAVDQAREARRLGWYPDHPRWSLNYKRHLRWALGRDGWRLQREIRRRSARLRELRMHHRGHAGGRVYRRW